MRSCLSKHVKSFFRCHIGGSRGTIPEPFRILRRIACRVLKALQKRTRCSKDGNDFVPWGDLAGDFGAYAETVRTPFGVHVIVF